MIANCIYKVVESFARENVASEQKEIIKPCNV